jgi:MFS family permease
LNPWPTCARLPRGPAAALAALHLRDPRPDALAELSGREWRQTLEFCYRSRIALFLRAAARDVLPPWVREQLDRDAKGNAERVHRLRETYRAIGSRFRAAGLDYVTLKGLAHCPLFGIAPEERAQYDIDLFCPREHVEGARDALAGWGYESIAGLDHLPTDHLPPLVRKTGWEFRGDYFDPEMPLAIELHYRFWNPALERMEAPGVEKFWERRVDSALAPPDALAFAALHVLRHLLQGSLSAAHVYELARFLDRHAADAAFWSDWTALHPPGLRALEAISFRLAQAWFGCEPAPEAPPERVEAWFRDFALSPATQPFHANKDELWLHVSLVNSRLDALAVARRRLFPALLPPANYTAHLPGHLLTWRKRAAARLQWLMHTAGRLRHHAVSMPRVCAAGARWWLGGRFWTFLAAAVLFNFALFIFVLLYNLHLLDLGFGESVVGQINGAATLGTVAGTVPAAWIVRRFGLRATLIATIATLAALIPVRTLADARIPLIGLAAVWGFAFAAWAVAFAPAVSACTDEKRRPAAFSVFFASMFAIGIAGNWAGGKLPGWVHGKPAALLISAALVSLALWPAWRLRLAESAPAESRIYPRSAFLARYLAPFAVWHLGTASFNQFASVYFARLHFSVERIGSLFSVSQAVQAATVLFAPFVLRRLGLVPGIVVTMFAAALALGGLAAQPAAAAASVAYTAYMAFQWMSEPGLNTLLMNNVKERERGGAAALNYLVAFSAQAVAAFGAGALLTRFGYGPVLAGAAMLAGGAAILFRMLITSRR